MHRCLTSGTLAILWLAPLHAAELHVAVTGNDANQGAKSAPLRTIQRAADLAQPGDVVTVHAGVYRERVNPPRGGASEAKRIVYQAAPGAKVEIKGSEVVKGWAKAGNDTWEVALPNSFFGDFNPYRDVIRGEWYHQSGFARHSGTVYLNGAWLNEAAKFEEVLKPVGKAPLWFGRVDATNTTLWAQFPGVDPNEKDVEINVRQAVFYPDQPGRNYITVRGFVMCNAATPWAGAMSEQVGLIGTHWSKGWILEDNEISYSMCVGVTLGRYKLQGVAMPPDTAEGYIESIRLALADGWSKENIGGHVIRNNRISHCEKAGIHGSLGGIFSTITGNTIHDICTRGWIGGFDTAGIKLLASHDTLISRNHIYRCGGWGGIWLDWMAQGTRVTGNLLHDNERDLFVEVNHGPFLVDNNVFLSGGGLLESCGGGAYAHNLFGCPIRLRAELTRETPFHKAHSTQIAGLSKVVGDDERFYNNLFVGHNGLAGYAKDAVNLQAGGNVFLAGSRPAANERSPLLLPGTSPRLELQERPDGWYLRMTMDDSWLRDGGRALVTSDVLGKAKVPDLPYEQPDGAPIRIDTDYFGKQRNAANPAPGPFENPGSGPLSLKVKHLIIEKQTTKESP